MSRFADLYGGVGRPTLETVLGRPAVYIRAGDELGSEVRTTLSNVMVLDTGSQPIENADGSRILVETLDVRISADPGAQFGGIAEPGENDAMEIDGTRWEIAHVLDRSETTIALRLSRRGRVEVGRAGLRRT